MSKRKQLAILGFCTALLFSCSLPSTSHSPSIQTQLMQAFNFEVKAGFQLSSVDSQDQDLIEDIKKQFQADLQAGKKSDYQKDKDFSIHLLSGSEGNYFTSPEFTQNSLTQVLATLVVVDSSQSHVFKGEYQSPRFVFADPLQEFEVSGRTKAYLLTAENGFDIQTYKGEIIPEQEVNTQTEESSPVAAETESKALSEAELAEAELETTEFRASVPGHKLLKEKAISRVSQPLPYSPPYQVYEAEAYPAPYRQAPERIIATYGQTQAVDAYPAYGYPQMPPAAVPVFPDEYGQVQMPYPVEFAGVYSGEKQVQVARERRRQAFEAMKQAAEKEAQYRRSVRPMSILDEE